MPMTLHFEVTSHDNACELLSAMSETSKVTAQVFQRETTCHPYIPFTYMYIPFTYTNSHVHTHTHIHTYTHTLTVKRNCVTIVIHISQIHCRQLEALLELHRERKQRIKLGLASANIPSHKSLIWGTTVAVSGSKTSPMGLWCVLSNLYPLDVF